jgi:hypothetical protein
VSEDKDVMDSYVTLAALYLFPSQAIASKQGRTKRKNVPPAQPQALSIFVLFLTPLNLLNGKFTLQFLSSYYGTTHETT